MWAWLACSRPEPLGDDDDDDATHSAAPIDAGLDFGGDQPRNLVIVSLDTTRRDHLGAFGGPVTTPFLDARLAEGVVLTDHRSCSNWTAPSMICAQTGRSPLDLGFWPGTGDAEAPPVPDALPTLARVLGREGYATTLVTGNAVFSSRLGGDGFDREIVLDYAGARAVADEARAVASALDPTAPFYLHVHFMDPHRPYCPPEEVAPDLTGIPDIGYDICQDLDGALQTWDTRDAAWRDALLRRVDATYAAELAWFDRELASLWGDLDAAGLLDDTLVLFHTDHGEQFMERGVMDHGFELHAEENRAAAGFWARNLQSARIDAPTLHQDLGATVFAALGVQPNQPVTGRTLAELTDDRARPLFAYSRADHGPPQLGVVLGDRVLLADLDGPAAYFDTRADPAERTPAPDDAERPTLDAALTALRAEVRAVFRW